MSKNKEITKKMCIAMDTIMSLIVFIMDKKLPDTALYFTEL